MRLRRLNDARLLFLTGKGGTGKTSFAAAFGVLAARQGRRVIVCEIDAFHPQLTGMLGVASAYAPVSVRPGLDICNITWSRALEEWLERTVHARRIVRRILSNRVVGTFLDATPGVRETVILSRLLTLTESYDQVIVDLPASGHATSLLTVPAIAIDLMGSGPIRDRSLEILQTMSAPSTALGLVALPEEMVVTETLETWRKLKADVPQLQVPAVLLNRASRPSLSGDEQVLLDRLGQQEGLDAAAEVLLQAGRWEAGLEQATAEALDRLGQGMDAEVVDFPRFGTLGGFEGGADRVVQQLANAIRRVVATGPEGQP